MKHSLVSMSFCLVGLAMQIHGFTGGVCVLHPLHCHTSSPTTTRSKPSATVHSMGIRSFIQNRRGNKGEKDDKDEEEGTEPLVQQQQQQEEEEDDEDDIQAAMEAIQKDLEAAENLYMQPQSKRTTASDEDKDSKIIPNTLANIFGSDDSSSGGDQPNTNDKKGKKKKKNKDSPSSSPSPSSASTYGETVKDRIKRVKAGSMTEEEKTAFLTTALTRTTPGSYNTGPPIRQAIPDPVESSDGRKRKRGGGGGGGGTIKGLINTDPLWNAVMGNTQKDTRVPQTKGGYSKGDRMNDDAKKKYLDMVTNPDRFSSYAAMGGSRKSTASADSVGAVSNEDESVPEVVEPLDDTEIDVDDGYSLGISSSPEPPKVKNKTTLAGRLEVAALLQEKRDKELKAQKELEKQAEKDRLAEVMRAQAEVARQHEEEVFRRRRVEKERLDRIEQEKKDVEDQKMADLLEAQDAYWEKKMTEDQKRKEEFMSEEERENDLVRQRQEALKVAQLERKKELERQQLQEIREEEQAREDPHESEILEEVSVCPDRCLGTF